MKKFKSFPNGKKLRLSKLKAFADDKLNVGEMMELAWERMENIVEKGENTSY